MPPTVLYRQHAAMTTYLRKFNEPSFLMGILELLRRISRLQLGVLPDPVDLGQAQCGHVLHQRVLQQQAEQAAVLRLHA